MMLRAPDAVRLHRVDNTQGYGMVVHDQPNNAALALNWQALLTEYADVFEHPGEPATSPIDHCIDLIDPNSVLPKP